MPASDRGNANVSARHGEDAVTAVKASNNKAKKKGSPQSMKSDSSADGSKRRKVIHACVYCRRSHMTCDEARPCTRCIKREIGHLCHDENPHRQGGSSRASSASPAKRDNRSKSRDTSRSQTPADRDDHTIGSHTSADHSPVATKHPLAHPAVSHLQHNAPFAPSPLHLSSTQQDISSGSSSIDAGFAGLDKNASIFRDNAFAQLQLLEHPTGSITPGSVATAAGQSLQNLALGQMTPANAGLGSWPYNTGLGLGSASWLGLGGGPSSVESNGGMVGDSAGGNEFSILSEFLESLDNGALYSTAEGGKVQPPGEDGISSSASSHSQHAPHLLHSASDPTLMTLGLSLPAPSAQPQSRRNTIGEQPHLATSPPSPWNTILNPDGDSSAVLKGESLAGAEGARTTRSSGRLSLQATPSRPTSPVLGAGSKSAAVASPTKVTAPLARSISSKGGVGSSAVATINAIASTSSASPAASALASSAIGRPTAKGPIKTTPGKSAATSSDSSKGVQSYPPGFSSKTEKFFLTAADQNDGTRDERLGKVIQAKYEAGFLRPYNHVNGYARLNSWMERNVSMASKRRILKPLSVFRPAFRAVASSLTNIDLIYIEEAFERLLLDYDRVFSTQGIPACLWRRTGEIYKGNREFAELIGVPIEALREGRLCIYELMAEESAVNYWEKYGAVSFDPGQKAVLTSCVLLRASKGGWRQRFGIPASTTSTKAGLLPPGGGGGGGSAVAATPTSQVATGANPTASSTAIAAQLPHSQSNSLTQTGANTPVNGAPAAVPSNGPAASEGAVAAAATRKTEQAPTASSDVAKKDAEAETSKPAASTGGVAKAKSQRMSGATTAAVSAALTSALQAAAAASAANGSGAAIGGKSGANSGTAAKNGGAGEEGESETIQCCFSFTIRRDRWNIPTMIVGNFLPMQPT